MVLVRWMALGLLVAMVVGCAGASGPSDETVKAQVTECLNSRRAHPGYSTFGEFFEVQGVVVKDKMVKGDECTLVVDFTVRTKPNMGGRVMGYGDIVPQIPSGGVKAGIIVRNSLTVKFNRFEKGWRMDCNSLQAAPPSNR